MGKNKKTSKVIFASEEGYILLLVKSKNLLVEFPGGKVDKGEIYRREQV